MLNRALAPRCRRCCCRRLQAEWFGRAHPREFVPAELLATEALEADAARQRSELAPILAPHASRGDCMAACCRGNDLLLLRCGGSDCHSNVLRASAPSRGAHLACMLMVRSPAGATQSLLSLARLPLQQVYGGQEVGEESPIAHALARFPLTTIR